MRCARADSSPATHTLNEAADFYIGIQQVFTRRLLHTQAPQLALQPDNQILNPVSAVHVHRATGPLRQPAFRLPRFDVTAIRRQACSGRAERTSLAIYWDNRDRRIRRDGQLRLVIQAFLQRTHVVTVRLTQVRMQT